LSALPLVTLDKVSIRLGGRDVLQSVSFDIGENEIVTLIGPNGGGKTTLVRLILGLARPGSGQVSRREGLRIGYVPQHFNVDWTLPMSVRRLMSLTDRHEESKVLEALEETGVAHLVDAEVQNLSGGEFRRVLLARALVRHPDLLVLDEPVQGVDFAGEIALYELIADIRRRRQCGILLVSHDLHIVMSATDRVICLNGHVCCSGVPGEVGASPEYVNLFGPRAAESFAVYTHHHDHHHHLDGAIADGSPENCGEGHQH
jgi:zinc transport system ATP-binding protein